MIVICEPYLRGLEHAQFNAALLCLVAEAFPDDGLIFCAEREHTNYVKRMVDVRVDKIRFVEIELPWRLPAATHLIQFALCQRIFRLADKNHATKIVFCSNESRNALVSIKVMLRQFPQISCVVVLHDLQQKVRSRMALQLFSYRFWLLAGNTAKMHYLIPGPPPVIEQGLKSYLPRLRNCVSPIDLPYVFADSARSEPFKDSVVRFGFYGHASVRKGADIFFKLADEMSAARTKYRPIFVLVGDVLDKQLKEMPQTSVYVPSPNAFLSQEEYQKYSKCIDYAVFFHQANAYELNGAAAIMDALSHLKPIIALKTPLSEYYFNKMGDVGYLCDSYRDVKSAVLEILETKPTGRYRVQQNNMLAGRDQFSPAGIAPKFRLLLEQEAC